MAHEKQIQNLTSFLFDRKIAEALQAGRQVEAEHRDCVTIFFSDIVNFTSISSELEPRKVADLLDRLYTAFDALSNAYDIFKVETIGDAYMAVTNLVKDQPDDHAKRIAEFGIAAIEAANETLIDTDDAEKGYVNIRCGFHSGPVVADVVGKKNPRYGFLAKPALFCCTLERLIFFLIPEGTVSLEIQLIGKNLRILLSLLLSFDSSSTEYCYSAHRMESNSRSNRIQCSRASADLLEVQCPDMPLRSRGKIAIKGKGEMQTYWVNDSRRPSIVPSNPPVTGNKYYQSGMALALSLVDEGHETGNETGMSEELSTSKEETKGSEPPPRPSSKRSTTT